MNKNKIYVILITIAIIILISFVVYINVTYKTPEEKWEENILNLNYVKKEYDDNSFFMSIIYKNDVTEEGVVLEGKILRGTVAVGDTISLVGVVDTKSVKVIKILNESNEEVQTASKDERINIVISGISESTIKEGQVLAKENTISAYDEFIAEIYILTVDEGGIDKSFKINDKLGFYIRISTFSGEIEDIKEVKKVKPGMGATIKVKLNTKVAIEEGTTFVIRYDSQTMGAGEIIKVIE